MRTLTCTLALLVYLLCLATASDSNTTSYTLTMNPVDEDFCDSTKQLSGYFKIDGSKSKNYFYWFFESRGSPSTDPVIIWLTGGPGCSSILALLQENGPCSVNDDLSLKRNPYSWNERANVMWIDQPVGVGFSYGDVSEYDTTEKEVGDDMFHFLQEFFQARPEYQKQPFYVFGESYAGHYVPAIAHRIFTGNQQKEGPVHINLQGFGIGNGLTDPEVQYKYYPDMAYNNTYGVKAVSYPVYMAMKAAVTPCVAMISGCQNNKAACLAAQAFCNAALVAPYSVSGLNVYDVRSKCEHPPMCYDFSHVEKFLRLESTIQKLHLVPPMLEAGIRGLVYAGDADFIVNWMGCKAWTLELPWSKHEEFAAAEDKDWIVDGKKAGKLRQVGPFTFQQVYEAGHMVPLDQPKNALELLKSFTLPEEQKEEREWVAKDAEKELMEMEALIKEESVMSVM
ncbi:hypothetical protein JM18_003130 [Phytophthora kernoviae]|uniref:Carboxypeptidase n=2 Tax=Phytophthora kernoviae TaxID=325452 RepID=A0A8T0LVX1_9STRA|nr:hypothetical protein G195_006565 [Phytophthora kernoviae 00238/432]KAG2522756.1 hypothetical protein JM16_004449 [Phytophthora kernoviae]KAG2527408.1 hypothetical protein JM18_003130 [Phytophthora kernoviae]